MIKNLRPLLAFAWLASFCLSTAFWETGHAASAAPPPSPAYDGFFSFGRQSIGIAGGYGTARPFRSIRRSELEDIQSIYLVPRWSIGISDPMGDQRWYRGNFELVVEGTFIYNFQPRDGFAGGVTPIFRYNFLTGGRLIPFLGGGVGIIGLNANLRKQADGFNFISQVGGGAHYFLSDRTALTADVRYNHISNAGISSRNAGINSTLFLLGITLFLR